MPTPWCNATWQLELAEDRELLDAPDGPFGNKGGLYIESRLRVTPTGAPVTGTTLALRVTSPTITTPLAGVPEPFLGCHYMKVLCPASSVLRRAVVAGDT